MPSETNCPARGRGASAGRESGLRENTIAEEGTGCRLAFVITEGWWLSLHWIGLAEAARDAGYEVTVVTCAGKHGERIRARGLNLIDIDFHRGRLSPWANLRVLCRLGAVYRQLRPHLVHHFAMQPIVLGAAAAALSGRPAVVNTIAGMGHLMVSGSVRARFLRCLLLPALGWALRHSHTIVQNPDDAAFVKSRGARASTSSSAAPAPPDTPKNQKNSTKLLSC